MDVFEIFGWIFMSSSLRTIENKNTIFMCVHCICNTR